MPGPGGSDELMFIRTSKNSLVDEVKFPIRVGVSSLPAQAMSFAFGPAVGGAQANLRLLRSGFLCAAWVSDLAHRMS
jgi:hypothetical protein